MQQINLKKGLDLQMAGAPEQRVSDTIETDSVAITSLDFPGLQPEFSIKEGDSVEAGQSLFFDRHDPEIQFTAPVQGTVERLSLGRRRTLDTVSIRRGHTTDRPPVAPAAPVTKLEIERESIQTLLLESGLWTAIRTRPFNAVPAARSVADDIFVTAMDTNPLAADSRVVLTGETESFKAGLNALSVLTSGNVYVCQTPGSPLANLPEPRIVDVAFSGPHPAGLPGTHIHFLAPVNRCRTVWYLDYQEVIALGQLLRMGTAPTTRVVALAGSGIGKPRLVRSTPGANLQQLVAEELVPEPVVVYSGSLLNARRGQWLGRYHSLVTVMQAEQPLDPTLTWVRRLHRMLEKSTSANHSVIAELWLDKVSPINILPVPLLRALALGNHEQAESLGCLELSDDDIAPWSWVCPSQTDYAGLLNECLEKSAEATPC